MLEENDPKFLLDKKLLPFLAATKLARSYRWWRHSQQIRTGQRNNRDINKPRSGRKRKKGV